MAHLLDSNSLIEAKDRYYGFDFCPGFWDWLEQQHVAGRVCSIDRIRMELEKGSDPLADWAKARPAFFLPLDEATLRAVTQVNTWVEGVGFKAHGVTDFLSGADPFLIAFAMVHGHTVVTDEVLVLGERRRVKIPVVCEKFRVPCVTPFDMLRAEGARLVLR